MFGTSYLFLSLALRASASIFFHEPSHVVLLPTGAEDHKTFGFSLAYQQNESTATLVTGAPHSGQTGRVFQCPFEDVLKKPSSQCGDVAIDVEAMAPYNRESAPNLKLNLGASVSVAHDYIFTCAPLWPRSDTQRFYGGTCFMYNGTAHRYKGILEQFQAGRPLKNYDDIRVGTGWRTLIDERNHVLMVARVAFPGDVAVVNASQPLAKFQSFVSSKTKKNNRVYFKDFQNIGTAMVFGNFFDKSKTFYAISSYDISLIQYTIHFFHVERNNKLYLTLFDYDDGVTRKKQHVTITETTVGSMFGAALGATDLDRDGYSELLVGAPAQADGDGGYEAGALHIYLGGDPAFVNDISRHCVITGTKEASRFGAAIAASDIDGDDFPEIFVSAPYEDSGEGALYVLSGFELNKQLIKLTGSTKRISLSSLQYTQRIKNRQFKTFGYSLQVLSDLDDNGCDELAVGSPGTENIMLLRCLPAIMVEVNIEEVGDKIVKEQDDSFTRRVCVNVRHLKEKPFSSVLMVTNKVIGVGAYIEPDQLTFQLEVNNTMKNATCRDVVVKLTDHDPHEYKFSSKVEMREVEILHSKEFKSTWATVSSHSTMEKSIDISRHCKDEDCEPNLSLSLGWSGKNDSYLLGSSDLLTVVLRVENEGNSSFDSCVRVRVSGAPVAQFGCTKEGDGYKCFMPRPLRRSDEHTIYIKLNMSQPTNLDEAINVQANLYDFCDKGDAKNASMVVKLDLTTQDILLKGSAHNQDISDTEIQDRKVPYVNDAHEYLISNNGSVYWKNISATISINKQPFIDLYSVSSPINECARKDLPNRIMFICDFDVPPRSTIKVIASTRIIKNEIMENLLDGKLNITSMIYLYLKPTSKIIVERLSTSITLNKEQSLAQNKGLIIFLAVLGAAIALGVLAYIMYRMEFFKRTEKTKLDALKQEHVRRQSVKRSMSMSQDKTFDEIINDMDLEVIDDSPFEVVDMTEPVFAKEDQEKTFSDS